MTTLTYYWALKMKILSRVKNAFCLQRGRKEEAFSLVFTNRIRSSESLV
jgi:hypothetical protein